MVATVDNVPLEPEDLNPTDRAILDELGKGRATPAFIAEKHGYTAGNVRNRMTSLAKHDHVNGLGGGLYELVDDPRPGANDVDLKELAEQLDKALDQLPEDESVTIAVEDVRELLREWADARV